MDNSPITFNTSKIVKKLDLNNININNRQRSDSIQKDDPYGNKNSRKISNISNKQVIDREVLNL